MSVPKSQVPQLLEASGAHAGRVHALPYGTHVAGRSGEADLRFDHPDVSRRHARLEVGPDGVVVEDLGSKNGVTVDGRGITGPTTVVHGHNIGLGELVLTLSHPASQVARTLARAGEPTVTTTHTSDRPPEPERPLLWPMVAVILFGIAVAALLLLE